MHGKMGLMLLHSTYKPTATISTYKNFKVIAATKLHLYNCKPIDEEKYTQLDKMKFLQSLKLQFHT